VEFPDSTFAVGATLFAVETAAAAYIASFFAILYCSEPANLHRQAQRSVLSMYVGFPPQQTQVFSKHISNHILL
jgi:hypothetical protein